MRRFVPFTLFLLLFLVSCGGDSEEKNVQNTPPAPDQTPTVIIVSDPNVDRVAAEVNGSPIMFSEVEKQIAFFEAGLAAQAADQDALLATVLERLIDQKLIEQAAAELGISVTDEQVQAEIAALQQEAASQNYSLDEFFAQQGITAEEYPKRIYEALLTEAVNAQVTANVPTTGPQVHARHILVKDEALARDILNQLANGADFAALALQYSQDPSTREAGGDLGWISPGDLLQPEVEAAIFALPANSRAPDPVQSILGYHIVESIERAEDRPLDPTRLAERRQQAWEEWLAQRRTAATIVRYVGPNAQQP